jgi:outer membrane protein TolC
MNYLIGIVLSLCAYGAQAASFSQIATPGLLSTSEVRPLFEQDPTVAAARADLEIARQEANILDRSPYEWTATATGQRREVQNEANYKEWNVGVERTVRLPGKASADRHIGKATMEEFEARYGDALHETARDLLKLWLDWLHAENVHELAKANMKSAEDNLNAVQKRVRAGDAAKLELSLATAELADQRRASNDAKTQVAVAWAQLYGRFPGIDRQRIAMPTPSPIDRELTFWRDRILDQSDELKTAEAQLRKAQANSERVRADKIPDPTLGVFTGTEFGGRERLVGISISIPIPGGHRNERAIQAVQGVEVKRQDVERIRRQIEADINSNVVTAEGSYESFTIAESAATAMHDNVKLMQKAYSLGEADLQALLAARRQATAAAQNALAAKTAALKGAYLLLIDAHLVWDLGHE